MPDQEEELKVQIAAEASSPGANVVPFINKVILRRQDDTFFLEGYCIDHHDVKRRVAAAKDDGFDPKDGDLVLQIPYVVRLAVSPSAMAELAKTAEPFWDRSLSELEKEKGGAE